MNNLTKLLKQFKLSLFKMVEADSKIETKILEPPLEVKKMKQWNPELFRKTITVPFIALPEEKLNKIQKKFKDNFFKVPKFKPFQSVENSTKKRVLLDPVKIKTFEDISEEDRSYLESVFGVGESDFGEVSVDLSVENFRPQVMLKAVLPTGEVEGLSSYSHIGHIIHVNLKEELYPFKSVIGQILLRLPNARIVVNKSSNIDSTFRNFEMEILAKKDAVDGESESFGKNEFVVSVKENGAKFEFDFSKVYWNPRLVTEHQRIVDLLRSGDTLYDVFAGVGPFAVVAAMKSKISKNNPVGIRVHANDLNPNSYDWLKHNFKVNKVPSGQYSCYNKDGKDFIKEEIKQGLIDYYSSTDTERRIHITMNLPAIAVTFLHNFHGLLNDVDTKDFVSVEQKLPPTVHVYMFSKADDKDADVTQLCEAEFGGEKIPDLAISFVRNVAPHKDMMRATFQIPFRLLVDVRQRQPQAVEKQEEEPEKKKLKIGIQ